MYLPLRIRHNLYEFAPSCSLLAPKNVLVLFWGYFATERISNVFNVFINITPENVLSSQLFHFCNSYKWNLCSSSNILFCSVFGITTRVPLKSTPLSNVNSDSMELFNKSRLITPNSGSFSVSRDVILVLVTFIIVFLKISSTSQKEEGHNKQVHILGEGLYVIQRQV